MARGSIFAGLNAGGMGLSGGGGLNKRNRKKPVVGAKAGVKTEAEGDFTIEDKRLNAGRPTNVPSVYGAQKAPFARNDPRFREWIVGQALKSKKRYRAFGNLEEAMAAAKAYGTKRV